MALTSGRPDIAIGLIDGPVAIDHPALVRDSIREVPGGTASACADPGSFACQHGTTIAGILVARRASSAPAICPDCTLLTRPIFTETVAGRRVPGATGSDLAAAIEACVGAGATVINLSVGLIQPTPDDERMLAGALEHACRRSVITVVAAGNEGMIGSSVLTRHPWVIPVVAFGFDGRPLPESNLGRSIGVRGLGAPGYGVTGLGVAGNPVTLGGTSVATPFVTGSIALLCSLFPGAPAVQVWAAVARKGAPRRSTIVPPLLDAWAAYMRMRAG